MKKWLNLFLLLPLLLAVGFFIFAYSNGSAPNWFATSTATPRNTKTPSVTSRIPSVTARSTASSTRTAQPSNTPTKRPSTATPTFAFVETLTPVEKSSSLPTATPASEEIRDGIAKGNEIVRALEVYHLDQGHYPPSLPNLVPNYIAEIPVTSTGQPFFYRLFDPTDPLASEIYWLAFRVTEQGHTVCTYFRRLEYWDCNFASP